jgi:serine protease Do
MKTPISGRWWPAILVAVAVATVGIAGPFEGAEAELSRESEVEAARNRLAARDLDGLQSAFRDVAKVVGASVVSIAEVPAPLAQTQGSDFQLGMLANPRLVVGSGVVLSADGAIVTNAHVARAARRPAVILSDRRVYRARVVGIDPDSDLAVLDIDAEELSPIALGDSEAMQVGDWVVAAGAPFGLSHTITTGIVSAIGRSDMGIADYEEFIQTDAAINPGNSGGPLVNLRGELVGINTAIASRTGSSAGIGFAIPSRMVRWIAQRLLETGRVERGLIGASIVDLDAGTAERLRIQANAGVVVMGVVAESAAARAGLRVGDVILRWDGRRVTNSNRFRNRVSMTAPGTAIVLGVMREGKMREISLTVGNAKT